MAYFVNNSSDVALYRRVLSNEEIIHNTIAMLNKEADLINARFKAFDTVISYGGIDETLDAILNGGIAEINSADNTASLNEIIKGE